MRNFTASQLIQQSQVPVTPRPPPPQLQLPSEFNSPISTSSFTHHKPPYFTAAQPPPPPPSLFSSAPFTTTVQQPSYITSFEHAQQQSGYPQHYPYHPILTPSLYHLKGETNLKSDFVKYLSEINQFRDTYDKNGMSDGTSPSYYQNPHQLNHPAAQPYQSVDNIQRTAAYTEQFPTENMHDIFTLNSPRNHNNNQSNAMPSHLASSGAAAAAAADYYPPSTFMQQQHQQRQQLDIDEYKKYLRQQYQQFTVPNIEITQHKQSNLAMEDFRFSNDDNKSAEKLNLFQQMTTLNNPVVDPLTATTKQKPNIITTQTTLSDNSSIRQENTSSDGGGGGSAEIPPLTAHINNATVSISNTSANVGAINTNDGVIKAIHQPTDDEKNYDAILSDAAAAAASNNNNNNNILSDNAAHPSNAPVIVRDKSIDYANDGRNGDQIYDKHEIDYQANTTTDVLPPNNAVITPGNVTETKQVLPIEKVVAAAASNIEHIEEVIYGEKIDYPPKDTGQLLNRTMRQVVEQQQSDVNDGTVSEVVQQQEQHQYEYDESHQYENYNEHDESQQQQQQQYYAEDGGQHYDAQYAPVTDVTEELGKDVYVTDSENVHYDEQQQQQYYDNPEVIFMGVIKCYLNIIFVVNQRCMIVESRINLYLIKNS